MIELLIAVLICVVLDLILMVRVLNGPSAADRLCASDALTLVTVFGLVLFSLYTGRIIYLAVSYTHLTLPTNSLV